MTTDTMTDEEIRQAGLEALLRALGPEGMARFLRQFEMHIGDYTAERHEWLGAPDVDTVVARIKQRRTARSTTSNQ